MLNMLLLLLIGLPIAASCAPWLCVWALSCYVVIGGTLRSPLILITGCALADVLFSQTLGTGYVLTTERDLTPLVAATIRAECWIILGLFINARSSSYVRLRPQRLLAVGVLLLMPTCLIPASLSCCDPPPLLVVVSAALAIFRTCWFIDEVLRRWRVADWRRNRARGRTIAARDLPVGHANGPGRVPYAQ